MADISPRIHLERLAYKVWKLLGAIPADADGSRERVTLAYLIAKAVRGKNEQNP